MVRLVEGPIDEAEVRQAVSSSGHGAILVFHGVTRDRFEGREVLRLAYEAYPPMALDVMHQIGQEIEARWSGARVAMVHRTGVVPTGEASVVIAVGAPHRAEAYEASRYAIDELKARVPIWKKEIYTDGSAWKANAPSG